MLLCIINDGDLMKKWINFVKFKFQLNENIEWHCMQFELNWIGLKFLWQEMQKGFGVWK
jgi:hypothetical protein